MARRKVPEETRREDILRAAYDVAARNGLEALTLRAVAARAAVSHGTVLFHFKRKQELVAGLLDRVLYATAVLRVPDTVQQITRPSERMHALLRSEMDRLSADPRHFRLFLDYWTIGVRTAVIRQKIRVALEEYRAAFATVAEAVVNAERELPVSGGQQESDARSATADGVAAVAVSLVHGCALQSVIDPKGFDVRQHFDAAAQMLDGLAVGRRVTAMA
jgi:TetR/AcrR family transcriptional regulator, transcriptional repressor of bet genes